MTMNTVWAGNLPWDSTDDELWSLFEGRCGPVAELTVKHKSDSSFAFVRFRDPLGFERALRQRDALSLRGQTLKVNFVTSQPLGPRPGAWGDSGGKGQGRGGDWFDRRGSGPQRGGGWDDEDEVWWEDSDSWRGGNWQSGGAYGSSQSWRAGARAGGGGAASLRSRCDRERDEKLTGRSPRRPPEVSRRQAPRSRPAEDQESEAASSSSSGSDSGNEAAEASRSRSRGRGAGAAAAREPGRPGVAAARRPAGSKAAAQGEAKPQRKPAAKDDSSSGSGSDTSSSDTSVRAPPKRAAARSRSARRGAATAPRGAAAPGEAAGGPRKAPHQQKAAKEASSRGGGGSDLGRAAAAAAAYHKASGGGGRGDPSAAKPGRTRIRVDNLPGDMTLEELKGTAGDFGDVADVKLDKDNDGGKSATINFGKNANVEKALRKLNNRRVEGWHKRLRARLLDQ